MPKSTSQFYFISIAILRIHLKSHRCKQTIVSFFVHLFCIILFFCQLFSNFIFFYFYKKKHERFPTRFCFYGIYYLFFQFLNPICYDLVLHCYNLKFVPMHADFWSDFLFCKFRYSVLLSFLFPHLNDSFLSFLMNFFFVANFCVKNFHDLYFGMIQ